MRATIIAIALALVAAASLGPAHGASSSTVVTAEIPSAIQLTNGCVGAAATSFGVVQPGGGGATTAANACTVSWGSSNDSSMLRIAQRDGVGTAMSRPATFTGFINWNQWNDVASVDGSALLAVGNGGNFGFSTDGGASWTVTPILAGNNGNIPKAAQQPGSPSTVWLVGADQRLQRVTNAFTAPSATDVMPNLLADGWGATSSPQSVVMVDSNSLLVGGEDGWIARSDDDGANWSVVQLPGTGTVRDFSHAPTGHVWAATRGSGVGNLWRSPDTAGGVLGDWTQFPVATGSVLTSVSVTGAANGYAVGTTGAIWSWNGTTWSWAANTALEGDDFQDVISPPGAPATAMVLGEDGVLLRTTNGGASWQRVDSTVGAELRGAAAGAGWMLAVGKARSTISSGDGGASWSYVSDEASARPSAGVAMEPVDGQVLLAVSTRGQVQRSTDAGASWSTIASGTTEPLLDVTFQSRTLAWAVGGGGTILRSDDAGASWSPVASGTTERLSSVSAPRGTQLVVAAGSDGTVARSTNGGASFSSSSVEAGRDLKAISMADDEVGVLVGFQWVRRTSDGGQTWSAPSSTPASAPLVDAVMVTPTLAFIVPGWNRVWRTQDGGDTWQETSGLTGDNYAIDAVNEDVIHFGGTNLYTSLDGGDSWQLHASPSPDIRSMAAGDGNAIAAGANVGTVQVRAAETTPGLAVPDYGAAPNSWAPSAEGMFGVCVQSIGAQTAIEAPWLVDGDTCTGSDADPWRGIPIAPTTIATAPVAGDAGSVELVWGVRFAPTQPPGTYTAGVVFEALAPML